MYIYIYIYTFRHKLLDLSEVNALRRVVARVFRQPLSRSVRARNKQCGETARDLSRSVCVTQCVCVLSNPKSGVLASSSRVQESGMDVCLYLGLFI